MKSFAETDTSSYRSGLQSFATVPVSEDRDGWVRLGDAGESILQSVTIAISNTRQIQRANQ